MCVSIFVTANISDTIGICTNTFWHCSKPLASYRSEYKKKEKGKLWTWNKIDFSTHIYI